MTSIDETKIRNWWELPHSGERNLVMRAVLGLVEGELGTMDAHDNVFVVVATRERADEVADLIPGPCNRRRMENGKWSVVCMDVGP